MKREQATPPMTVAYDFALSGLVAAREWHAGLVVRTQVHPERYTADAVQSSATSLAGKESVAELLHSGLTPVVGAVFSLPVALTVRCEHRRHVMATVYRTSHYPVLVRQAAAPPANDDKDARFGYQMTSPRPRPGGRASAPTGAPALDLWLSALRGRAGRLERSDYTLILDSLVVLSPDTRTRTTDLPLADGTVAILTADERLYCRCGEILVPLADVHSNLDQKSAVMQVR